jgi:hypothetical protein
MKVTDDLGLLSSSHTWVEPARGGVENPLRRLGEFAWRIALMDPSGSPPSRAQTDWFDPRSGAP